jgi:CBS domain containing-hemolysin-like protein
MSKANLLFEHVITLAATAGESGGEVQGSVSGLLLFMAIALGISFLCSILEAVLLSTSLSHVELMAGRGRPAARLMRKQKQDIDKAISAILTLNTIAHTVGAAGAGAQAAAVFGNEWIGLISAVLTFLILVFSEIIPKTLGAVYWKQLMIPSAYVIQLLVLGLYPVVWAFQVLTQLITPKEKEPTVTRSELEILAKVSSDEGALEEKESLILGNLLRLSRVQVKEIMTPRTVLFALQREMTVGEVMKKHRFLSYSRIPIYQNNPDDCNSFVLRHNILSMAAQDRHQMQLRELARPIHAVPETLDVATLLEKFMTRQIHIFLVFDEYGGTEGIVTLEDAVESLLGAEITDESDVATDMRELARQRYSRYQQLVNLTRIEKAKKSESGEVSSPVSSD